MKDASSLSKPAKYVGFAKVPDTLKHSLKGRFLKNLEQTCLIEGVGDRFNDAFLDALENEQMKLNFFAPTDKLGLLDKSVYEFPILAMISSHVDFKLEKLGERWNFPRGFPILWWVDKVIDFFGFRPKFKNDNRATRQIIKAKGHALSKKLSGYLGQAIAFMMDGEHCWTACSKNSANSISEGTFEMNFVADAAKLYTPYMTNRVVLYMIEHNIHINSEMLSEFDRKHGANVIMNAPVTTTAGRGARIDIDKGEARDIPSVLGFVTFIDRKSVV